MKYTFETEINAPLEKVAELAGNPDHRKKWMQGLESDEHMSGTPGVPGAKSRLVFRTGNVRIAMIGTVTSRNLPYALSETFEASNVLTLVKNRFVALSPQKTKYVSEQEFRFKGLLNRVVGFLLQAEFKKQTREHMEGFRRFAENVSV